MRGKFFSSSQLIASDLHRRLHFALLELAYMIQREKNYDFFFSIFVVVVIHFYFFRSSFRLVEFIFSIRMYVGLANIFRFFYCDNLMN